MAAAAATHTPVGFGPLSDSERSHRNKGKKHAPSSSKSMPRKELVLPWFISTAEGQEFAWADCLGDGMDDFHRKRVCGTYTTEIAIGSVDQVEVKDPISAETYAADKPPSDVVNAQEKEREPQVPARAKTPEKTLSKKQKKQQEMEELDAILNEMGIEATTSKQEESTPQETVETGDEVVTGSANNVLEEQEIGAESAARKKKRNKTKKAATGTQQPEVDSNGDNHQGEFHSQGVAAKPTRPPVPGGAAKKSSSSGKSSTSGAKSAAAKAAAEAKARKDKKGKKK